MYIYIYIYISTVYIYMFIEGFMCFSIEFNVSTLVVVRSFSMVSVHAHCLWDCFSRILIWE